VWCTFLVCDKRINCSSPTENFQKSTVNRKRPESLIRIRWIRRKEGREKKKKEKKKMKRRTQPSTSLDFSDMSSSSQNKCVWSLSDARGFLMSGRMTKQMNPLAIVWLTDKRFRPSAVSRLPTPKDSPASLLYEAKKKAGVIDKCLSYLMIWRLLTSARNY